jgi:uncharacterized protein (TIGR02246 family)
MGARGCCGEGHGEDMAGQAREGAAPSFEERLRALEDEREIRDLIITYAQRLDARDYRGYARLFASDGRWSGRMGDATGPEAIEAMLREGLGPVPEGWVNTQNFHLMSNIVVRVEGDRAEAESRLVYFARTEDAKPGPMLAGRYYDELVREDDRWRFSYRRVVGEIPTREEKPVRTAEEEGHVR